MKKYIVLFVLVLAGIVLLSKIGLDTTAENTNKAERVNTKKEPALPTKEKTEEPKKSIKRVKKEKPAAAATVNSVQPQEIEEERQMKNTTVKPKRKLLGGADVDWIEEQEPKKGYGKFGPPPM